MTIFPIYPILWGICMALAIILTWHLHHRLSILSSLFVRFLFVPWKLATFAIAFLGINVVAPYTGDPTWDYGTASIMSVCTFLTAPWVVGILCRAFYGKENLFQVYIAICLWLFSASWSYDLYLLIRDGYYPVTWLANLFASSILYLCAGLFWNLSFKPNRGVHFAFTETDWPSPDPVQQFSRIIWYALPFMILVSAMILYFVVPGDWF